MHQAHAPASDQRPQRSAIAGQRGRQRSQSPGVDKLAAQDAQRADQDLDPGCPQVLGQATGGGEDDDRHVAVRVQAAGDQGQLAVGAVATARGVQEQYGGGPQSATVSAGAGASGTSSG